MLDTMLDTKLKKQTVKKTLQEDIKFWDWDAEPLEDLIKALTEINEKHSKDGKIIIDVATCIYEGGPDHFDFELTRLETDEELYQRVNANKIAEQRNREFEYKEYLRLKKEFKDE